MFYYEKDGRTTWLIIFGAVLGTIIGLYFTAHILFIIVGPHEEVLADRAYINHSRRSSSVSYTYHTYNSIYDKEAFMMNLAIGLHQVFTTDDQFVVIYSIENPANSVLRLEVLSTLPLMILTFLMSVFGGVLLVKQSMRFFVFKRYNRNKDSALSLEELEKYVHKKNGRRHLKKTRKEL